VAAIAVLTQSLSLPLSLLCVSQHLPASLCAARHSSNESLHTFIHWHSCASGEANGLHAGAGKGLGIQQGMSVTYGLVRPNHGFHRWQCSGRFLGIISEIPSVSKSHRLHVAIF
jgi:hypothetical protein